MRDTKEEYLSLYRQELANFTDCIIGKIKGTEQRSLIDLVELFANKMDDISNADFNDNFNPEHAAEQGEINRDAKREDGVQF